MVKNSSASTNNDVPVRPPSLSKKLNNINFYNSTYDSAYPINNSENRPLSPQATSSFSTDDLAQLESFDEQTIINYMYNRFLANQIYTYIGDILVVSKPTSSTLPSHPLNFLRLSIHFVHYQSTVKTL